MRQAASGSVPDGLDVNRNISRLRRGDDSTNLRDQPLKRLLFNGPHINDKSSLWRDRVDTDTAFENPDIQGCLRVSGQNELVQPRDHCRGGMDRARTPECAPAVTTRTGNDYLDAPRTNTNMGNRAKRMPFERNRRSNFWMCIHDRSHATKVTQSFFADITRHENIDIRGDAKLREQPLQERHSRDADRVVTDTRRMQPAAVACDGYVHAARKHGIDMCGNQHRPRPIGSGDAAGHVMQVIGRDRIVRLVIQYLSLI